MDKGSYAALKRDLIYFGSLSQKFYLYIFERREIAL